MIVKTTVVKIKTIKLVGANGNYETKDRRFNTTLPIERIVKFCLKNKLAFKVGFRDDMLITNRNYIEITNDWFLRDGLEKTRIYEACEKLKDWLKRNIHMI